MALETLLAASLIKLWFGWPNGGVWSNIVASVIWSSPIWFLACLSWRRHRCRGSMFCHRKGVHEVHGTTWKVCANHHYTEHHERLFHKHQEKHPDRLTHGESHKLLS